MRRGVVLGFFGWMISTAFIRGFPNLFLPIDMDVFVSVFLIFGLLAMLIMMLAIKVICEPGKALRFGVGICMPGMVLDSAAVLTFERAFPWADPSMAGPFGAMMLWAYGLMLALTLVYGDRIKPMREAAE